MAYYGYTDLLGLEGGWPSIYDLGVNNLGLKYYNFLNLNDQGILGGFPY